MDPHGDLISAWRPCFASVQIQVIEPAGMPQSHGSHGSLPQYLSRIHQRGAMRIAPSRRTSSPLKYSFSMMANAKCAYSAGAPKRFG
jgi:hypothetical protein